MSTTLLLALTFVSPQGSCEPEDPTYPYELGVEILSTQHAGIGHVQDAVREMRALTIRAVLAETDAERVALNRRVQGYLTFIDEEVATAIVDGIHVLDGTGFPNDFCFERPGGGPRVKVWMRNLTTGPSGLWLSSIDISTVINAVSALSSVDTALDTVATHSQLVCAPWEDLAGDQGCARGETYCPAKVNSTGHPATLNLHPASDLVLSDGRAGVLYVTYAPPGQPVLLLYGREETHAPFGDGILCIGPRVRRYGQPTVPGPGPSWVELIGTSPSPTGGVSGPFRPGSTWNFQGLFRDPGAGAGAGFNLTSAVQVTFQP